jgi:hypothetical protein
VRALEPGDPRTVGRYRILARLGTGGMAIVYFGRSLGRRAAAVKVMHAEFAAEPAYRDRFRREVRATQAAGGRHSPSILDADLDAGIPWLAAEFLPSVSLRDAVGLGPLPAGAVWPLAAGLAEALASIHDAGIAHLDLKPANVLLTGDGPRLIDFGIAAELGPDGTAPGGTPAGSWGFMSPEQVAGAAVSPASDVFSLGATLAYAHTGIRSSGADLDGIADGELRALLADCLRPTPAARPAVAQLLERLATATAERGAAWLPAAVVTEIDRRAGAAANPPVGPPGQRGGLSRRTVLLSGATAGALAVAGGVAAVASRPDDSDVDGPGPAAARPSTTPSATPTPAPVVVPAASPATRTVEFYAYGKTTVKTLTTAVDDQAVTVRDVQLPYRRTVQVPPSPATARWRVAFHCTAGVFKCAVLVDGSEVGGAGQWSNNPDMKGDEDGEI